MTNTDIGLDYKSSGKLKNLKSRERIIVPGGIILYRISGKVLFLVN